MAGAVMRARPDVGSVGGQHFPTQGPEEPSMDTWTPQPFSFGGDPQCHSQSCCVPRMEFQRQHVLWPYTVPPGGAREQGQEAGTDPQFDSQF